MSFLPLGMRFCSAAGLGLRKVREHAEAVLQHTQGVLRTAFENLRLDGSGWSFFGLPANVILHCRKSDSTPCPLFSPASKPSARAAEARRRPRRCRRPPRWRPGGSRPGPAPSWPAARGCTSVVPALLSGSVSGLRICLKRVI